MDMRFPGFARLLDRGRPLPLDYGQLVATLAARQAACATAVVETRLAQGVPTPVGPRETLVALFTAGSRWEASRLAPHGSFDPRVADQTRGNLM